MLRLHLEKMILFVQEIDKQSNLLNITITIPLSSLYYTTVVTIVELVLSQEVELMVVGAPEKKQMRPER